MAVWSLEAPSLRATTAYSIVGRCRELEIATYPVPQIEQKYLKYLGKNGAATAGYVIGINREGVTPDAPIRNPIEPFRGSDTILATIPLQDKPGTADMHVIGGVTGPYVASEGDWHGMFLVTRNEHPVPTFGQLHSEELQNLHTNIQKTFHTLRKDDPEALTVAGFSFSPFESKRTLPIQMPGEDKPYERLFPRSPVQNLASIHGHIVKMHEDTLYNDPLSPIEKFDTRMTHEPELDGLIDLYQKLVVNPILSEFPHLPLEYSERTEKNDVFPKGAFFKTPKDTFATEEFARFVKRLHQQTEQVYWQIADVFASKTDLMDGKVFMRQTKDKRERLTKLLSLPEFQNVGPSGRRILRKIALMKDPNTLVQPDMYPGNIAKALEKCVLLGPAYNAIYYPEGDNIVLAIVPRWLTGASPLETIGVFKDQQTVSSEDFQPILQSQKEIGRQVVQALTQTKPSLRRNRFFPWHHS